MKSITAQIEKTKERQKEFEKDGIEVTSHVFGKGYIEGLEFALKEFKALSEIGLDGAETYEVHPLKEEFCPQGFILEGTGILKRNDKVVKFEPVAAQIIQLKQENEYFKGQHQHEMNVATSLYQKIEQLEAENKRLNELFENIKNCIGEDDSEDKITLLLRAESAGKGTE